MTMKLTAATLRKIIKEEVKAASAAVTDYIAGAFPGLDPVAVHGAVNKIVARIYGR